MTRSNSFHFLSSSSFSVDSSTLLVLGAEVLRLRRSSGSSLFLLFCETPSKSHEEGHDTAQFLPLPQFQFQFFLCWLITSPGFRCRSASSQVKTQTSSGAASTDVDRKALRESLYSEIFQRHRRSIFALGSFLRMLKTKKSNYNVIKQEADEWPRTDGVMTFESVVARRDARDKAVTVVTPLVSGVLLSW